LQGYPGIPASETRPEAHLSGAIAVQIPSSKGVEAAWLRVEMCKTETVPRGESWKELIGQGPVDVWTAGEDGNGWATLTTVCTRHSPQRQCPFRLTIPERLPPTLSLEKGGGITYKLIASLKVRLKKGLMRKELYETVVQDVRDIVLEKHEQHSTWPIYKCVPMADPVCQKSLRPRKACTMRHCIAIGVRTHQPTKSTCV